MIQVAARCCVGNRTQRMAVWRALLTPLQASGIPTVLQVADPGEEFTMAVEDVASLCDEFPDVVRGLELAEVKLQTAYTEFGGDPADILGYNARNFIQVVEMAAARGLVVFGQIDFLRWTHVLSDLALQPLLVMLRNYSRYVVPINEMIAPNAHLRHTSVMGLWLSDVVTNFGVEPQSWFWQNSGYVPFGFFFCDFGRFLFLAQR